VDVGREEQPEEWILGFVIINPMVLVREWPIETIDQAQY
jgi:hypothetical protein